MTHSTHELTETRKLRLLLRFLSRTVHVVTVSAWGTTRPHTDWAEGTRAEQPHCMPVWLQATLSSRRMQLPSARVFRSHAPRDHPDAGCRGRNRSTRAWLGRNEAAHRRCGSGSIRGIGLLWVMLLCQQTAASIVVDAPVRLSFLDMFSNLQTHTPCHLAARLSRMQTVRLELRFLCVPGCCEGDDRAERIHS